jgi:hypothetical protein
VVRVYRIKGIESKPKLKSLGFEFWDVEAKRSRVSGQMRLRCGAQGHLVDTVPFRVFDSSFGMLRQSGLGFQGRCACAAVRKVIS